MEAQAQMPSNSSLNSMSWKRVIAQRMPVNAEARAASRGDASIDVTRKPLDKKALVSRPDPQPASRMCDADGVMETEFYMPNTFRSQEAAIEAAIQAGRQKIDMGFEPGSTVVNG